MITSCPTDRCSDHVTVERLLKLRFLPERHQFYSESIVSCSIDVNIKNIDTNSYVSMNSKLLGFQATEKFLPTVRLDKNLCTRKGSRRGNSGNHLELQVLTLIHHVP